MRRSDDREARTQERRKQTRSPLHCMGTLQPAKASAASVPTRGRPPPHAWGSRPRGARAPRAASGADLHARVGGRLRLAQRLARGRELGVQRAALAGGRAHQRLGALRALLLRARLPAARPPQCLLACPGGQGARLAAASACRPASSRGQAHGQRPPMSQARARRRRLLGLAATATRSCDARLPQRSGAACAGPPDMRQALLARPPPAIAVGKSACSGRVG